MLDVSSQLFPGLFLKIRLRDAFFREVAAINQIHVILVSLLDWTDHSSKTYRTLWIDFRIGSIFVLVIPLEPLAELLVFSNGLNVNLIRHVKLINNRSENP